MTLADDFNPKFVFFSPVRTAVTDRRQVAEHVDHAIIALDRQAPASGDCCIELLNSIPEGSTVRVDLWVNDLSDFTCTYCFTVSSENGSVPYARGERLVMNIDPASRQRSKWSTDFRHSHSDLLKDLPAYA